MGLEREPVSREDEPEKCPQCGVTFISDSQGRCARCGIVPAPGTPRRVWLRYFFIVVLGTPVLTLGTLAMQPLLEKLFRSGFPVIQPGIMAPWIAVGGAFASGYLVSRARRKTGGTLFLATIFYGGLVLFVYGMIAFAGCVFTFKI